MKKQSFTPATITIEILKMFKEHDEAINKKLEPLSRHMVNIINKLDNTIGKEHSLVHKEFNKCNKEISDLESELILPIKGEKARTPFEFPVPDIDERTPLQAEVCKGIIADHPEWANGGAYVITPKNWEDIHPSSLRWWMHHVHPEWTKIKIIKRKQHRDLVVLINYNKQDIEPYRTKYLLNAWDEIEEYLS